MYPGQGIKHRIFVIFVYILNSTVKLQRLTDVYYLKNTIKNLLDTLRTVIRRVTFAFTTLVTSGVNVFTAVISDHIKVSKLFSIQKVPKLDH